MSEPDVDAATTPRQVTRFIGDVLRRKRAMLDTLRDADLDARNKRRGADTAEARCFLNAEGSIPARKYQIDTDAHVDELRQAADVAEVLVGHLRRMIAHHAEEIEGARTVAATLRQEYTVLGLSDEGS